MAFKLPPDFYKKVIIGIISGIFLLQILSILATQIFNLPIIKGGSAILLLAVAIGVIALFNVAFSIEKLKSRENIIFILVVFGLIFVAFYFGPKYFSNIFSIEPNISNSLKNTIGSIFGVG